MKNFRRFFIILPLIIFAGLLHAQTPVELGEYVSCSKFCSSDCGGQETIYFEPSTGYIVTTAIKDRADVYSYTSTDGGANWSAVSPVNTGGEVRTVSVSGDANSPIFVYSKRGDTPTTAPWARHVTYIAMDDFGWGGGSYSEAVVADAGTETDVMDSYYPHFDISPFDANLRGVASHHGSSQAGGEYQQFFYSLDGGQTWSERIKVVIVGDKDTLNYVGDLKSLTFDFQYAPNGVILAAGTAKAAAGGDEHLWYSMSADSGQTWGDVSFIAAADSIEVNWDAVDRGYKVFLDADNNFHVFALGRGPANSSLYKAYDFKLTGETWTGNCIVEPMLIDKGLAAIEAEFGDAAPLNAPTLNISDGTIFYSFIDVADTTGGVNDYRLYTIYSTDGGAAWSDRVELISDPEFQAEEFTDVARTANDNLHVTYCKIEVDTITQYYVQVPKDSITTAIDIPAGVVNNFLLHQNYPNPFNPATTIQFELKKKSTISLIVYNIVGEKIATLIDNKMFSPGLQEIEWNAVDFASGVYFYQLKTAGESCITKKMILLK
jgi:hypothetical protein